MKYAVAQSLGFQKPVFCISVMCFQNNNNNNNSNKNNNNNNHNNSNNNNNKKKKNQVIYIMKEHVHKFSRSIYGNNWELRGYSFCGFV